MFSERNESRVSKRVIIGSSLLLLVIVGCSQPTPEGSTSVDDAPAQPPISVEVARAETTALQPGLDLVGAIVAIPERTAVISPQLGGWVSKLNVVEGQSVDAEGTLVEFDRRSAQVAVQRAAAIVAEKAAAVKRLTDGYLPQEIAGARQDAANAAATVDALKTELTALKDLLDKKELSNVVYQTKTEALKSAEAALASLNERVKLLEAGTRPESIAEAQGLLDAAKADLEQAQLTLEWCTITSPLDGVVVQLLARRGQFFDRAVPLATVMDLSEVFVQIPIPNSQFTKVHQATKDHPGTQVEIRLSSLPGKSFPGEVTRISGQAEPTTGNVFVYATIENDDKVLRPGLNCQVHVSLPELPDTLVVPVAAVGDNSGTSVVTIIRDGKAYETEVKLGITAGDQVQILNGLSPGDVIATAGGYGLPDGCPVQVVADLEAPHDSTK